MTATLSKMRQLGVEPRLQEPESCVRSITLSAHYSIIVSYHATKCNIKLDLRGKKDGYFSKLESKTTAKTSNDSANAAIN